MTGSLILVLGDQLSLDHGALKHSDPACDVVLMADDLTKLPYAIELSRRARRIVWQNIAFSLGIIVMLILGVFFINLPLPLGVVGHEGSTLVVVANGLRLLRRVE